MRSDGSYDGPGPCRDVDADLTKDTAGGVDADILPGQTGGTEPVQGHHDLLIHGFYGDGMNVFVPEGFQEGFGVVEICLVAGNVWTDRMGRQKDHRVAEVLKLPSPVMGAAAGFENNGCRLKFGKELQESGFGEAMVFADMAGFPGDGDLKYGVCKIDFDCGRIHPRLLL